MFDMIFLKGLVVHAHHGVMPHEGRVGQRFVIDLELRNRSQRGCGERPA